jgi:hypothetical protein
VRDALAEEVKTVYAEAVAKLVPTLSRIEQINVEVSRLCQAKPTRAPTAQIPSQSAQRGVRAGTAGGTVPLHPARRRQQE